MAPGQLYRFAWVFYLLLALTAALWIGIRDGGVQVALFVDTSQWWLDLGLGLAGGLLLVLLWDSLTRLVAQARALNVELARLVGPLPRGEVVGLACLSGFAEELMFRGAVQGSMGVVWATLLFALLHSGPGPTYRLWTLFALLAGALLAALMWWRGNLLAPMAAHVVVNAINLARLPELAEAEELEAPPPAGPEGP